ncbi:hypothetical protein TRFO_21635 [Tritrichomonas foetus]|uniref:Uncharacterized protein n=1 Tax=Tritrichomonas foetus TaxID=1144522 RepID=A0A1J4KJ95_9EUKA|nr:hypothetical protein TRFO_21635 [Tritrichomonas foetus]|eukprot:OHT09413.1 hypothetical protein TRFO_21635 [Tritrichomonas foetus]
MKNKKYSRKGIKFINEIFFHLGNYTYFKINLKYRDSITINNVVHRIQDKLLFHSPIANSINNQNLNPHSIDDAASIQQYLEEEILFASSHFYEISEKDLEKIKFSIIELILKNQQLSISNEDSLFSLILSLYLKDNSFGVLFEYIEFQNFSPNSIEQFIKHYDLCDINLSILSSICKRLCEVVKKKPQESCNNKGYSNIHLISYNNQNFKGIYKKRI